MSEKTIRIVEYPGYMKTLDDVFDIESGTYTFIVENRSHKTSEFVVVKNNDIPIVIQVHKGETIKMDVELQSGSYSYYCPIIPTPPYPIKVK